MKNSDPICKRCRKEMLPIGQVSRASGYYWEWRCERGHRAQYHYSSHREYRYIVYIFNYRCYRAHKIEEARMMARQLPRSEIRDCKEKRYVKVW